MGFLCVRLAYAARGSLHSGQQGDQMAAGLRSVGKAKAATHHGLAGTVAGRGASSPAQLLSVLNGVAMRTVERLTSAATTIHLGRRATIYMLGEECTGLHVVLSGMVALSVPVTVSATRVVALLGPAAWFGESALFLREPHAVAAATVEPTTLAHIPAEVVRGCLREDHTFAACMLAEISRRLRTSLLESTSNSSSARHRVLRFLLDELASTPEANDRVTVELPAVKQVIASRLNIASETLSRAFRELSREGLIRVDGPRIVVSSVNRLRVAYADCERTSGRGP